MFTDNVFLASQMQDILQVVFGRSQRAEEERSAGSSDKQHTVDDSDEEWMTVGCGSLSTVTPGEAPAELHAEASQLREKQQMTHMAVSSIATARTARVEDLQAENALLRRQLKEARVFTVPSTAASATASLNIVDGLQMQNHRLLKTVTVLQEEIATLRQKQRSMELVIQDNIDLQRKHQEMSGRMLLLIDDIDHLKNQLSAERQRCADAEEQRCAQKQLFHKMFTQVKHDMDQSSSQQASVYMNEKGAPLGEYLCSTAEQRVFPFDKWNAPASELFAEDKFKDEMAHTHGMKTSSRFLLAEDSLRSAAPRCNGKPITTSQPTFNFWS